MHVLTCSDINTFYSTLNNSLCRRSDATRTEISFIPDSWIITRCAYINIFSLNNLRMCLFSLVNCFTRSLPVYQFILCVDDLFGSTHVLMSFSCSSSSSAFSCLLNMVTNLIQCWSKTYLCSKIVPFCHTIWFFCAEWVFVVVTDWL